MTSTSDSGGSPHASARPVPVDLTSLPDYPAGAHPVGQQAPRSFSQTNAGATSSAPPGRQQQQHPTWERTPLPPPPASNAAYRSNGMMGFAQGVHPETLGASVAGVEDAGSGHWRADDSHANRYDLQQSSEAGKTDREIARAATTSDSGAPRLELGVYPSDSGEEELDGVGLPSPSPHQGSLVGWTDVIDKLSLMTFNAGLLDYKLCKVTLYQNPPFTNTRLQSIPVALRASEADIVALQEVYTEAQADFIVERTRATFPFCGRRTSGGLVAMHNGLMTLSKFPIIATKFHPFSSVRIYASLSIHMHLPLRLRVHVCMYRAVYASAHCICGNILECVYVPLRSCIPTDFG
eukprot:GHVU01097369.1.p1 GENE.GHVU01097369.1~~GHVU01097369.1.p1  ORF type:complete len:395 (-),score=32.08 GHVU01097369.1:663-1712(-)